MSATRRQAFRLGAGLLGWEAFARVIHDTAQPAAPNVVFLLADDLGWSDTAIYAGDLVESPNLTRLAHSGVRFTNAYSAAPVCSPTRASFLTGKYPARLHMTTWYEAADASPTNKS